MMLAPSPSKQYTGRLGFCIAIPRAICEACYEIDPEIIMYYCAGAVLGEEAEKTGLSDQTVTFGDIILQ